MSTEVLIMTQLRDNRKGGVKVSVEAVWSQGGLAVTYHLNQECMWVITHTSSGYAVLEGFTSPCPAIRIARQLLTAGNWRRDRTRTVQDKNLHAAVHAARRQAIREDLLK